jgi:hypothetical protein
MKKKSNWGGYREGSGQKPKWKSGETKPLRLPVKLHNEILEYARLLDSGEYTREELLSCDINSKLDSVTESSKENVTLSSRLKDLITNWKMKAKRTSNPKWEQAKKLLADLENLLEED